MSLAINRSITPNLRDEYTDVIKNYTRGIISLGYKMEADVIIKDALENAPAMDIANSKKIKSLLEDLSIELKELVNFEKFQ